MVILGIGIDILPRGRMTPALMGSDSAFVRRVYATEEQQDCLAAPDPELEFALRFSAKEAVFKTLRADPDTARLNEISIRQHVDGGWVATLHGRLASAATTRGIQTVHIDIDHTDGLIVSFAVAEGTAAAPT